MLVELSVRDFGIIAEIQWCPEAGLNVVTGETGAGKSLVVDAVEALLTGRAAEGMVRHGAGEARIEGVFRLSQERTALARLLAENGLGGDEDSLVLSCRISEPGRSLVRVNGKAVTRGLLRGVGGLLVDVHGQSEHLSLLNKKFHLDFLDACARNLSLRQEFAEKAAELLKTEEELLALTAAEKERARRGEFLRFQIEEIEKAALREDEEAELDQERRLLMSGEQRKELSFAAYQALTGEETARGAVRDSLNEALQLLRKLAELDPAQQPRLEFLETTLYGLEEAAREIRAYHDGLDFDPARLEQVEARRELIHSLRRKYGDSVAAILRYLAQAQEELGLLETSEERRAALEGARAGLRKEMGRLAAELSRAREKAARDLEAAVKTELRDLNMAQVGFSVSITRREDAEGVPFPGGKTYSFSADGADEVEFLAATNPGEPEKPLARIASTGEISRFMLALKSALAGADNIPVLIFDEIDIGVGGRSGEIIGKKLWALARQRQVICVTHLPQIAAFADAHFRVTKEMSGSRTLSTLEALPEAERKQEMALMLAGSHVTETSLKNAGELMARAEDWKKTAGG
ncbi:MAG: DNA repair protein RecN [Chloroflexota bacterium]